MAEEKATPDEDPMAEGQLSEDDMEAVVGGLGGGNLGILGEAGMGEAI